MPIGFAEVEVIFLSIMQHLNYASRAIRYCVVRRAAPRQARVATRYSRIGADTGLYFHALACQNQLSLSSGVKSLDSLKAAAGYGQEIVKNDFQTLLTIVSINYAKGK